MENQDIFAYDRIYSRLRSHLIAQGSQDTREITRSIKTFFCLEYPSPWNVLCSGDASSEYMVDVLVTSFRPKEVIRTRTLDVLPTAFEVPLAVESELGGVSASSAYGVMRNAVEDFLKLLLISARRRVMIMTSLPYKREEEHVVERIEILRKLYVHFPSVDSGALIVHLEGWQPTSTQVRAKVSAESIRGFLISRDGKSVEELPPTNGLSTNLRMSDERSDATRAATAPPAPSQQDSTPTRPSTPLR